jgi:hypothetical protein
MPDEDPEPFSGRLFFSHAFRLRLKAPVYAMLRRGNTPGQVILNKNLHLWTDTNLLRFAFRAELPAGESFKNLPSTDYKFFPQAFLKPLR